MKMTEVEARRGADAMLILEWIEVGPWKGVRMGGVMLHVAVFDGTEMI